VPEKVGNVAFGAPGRDVLYIAASTSLYRIRLATRGVQRP
jgi:gluconolactonase